MSIQCEKRKYLVSQQKILKELTKNPYEKCGEGDTYSAYMNALYAANNVLLCDGLGLKKAQEHEK